MKHFTLYRLKPDEQGTWGFLTDGLFFCHTIELPYYDNKPNISSIPFGKYLVLPYKSNKFGNVFIVTDVPGRSSILLHSGNFAGDTSKGYRTHSYGCILLGRKFGILKNQKACLLSRMALNDFRRYMGMKRFLLVVKGA